eukprot:2520830-Rhodomonas_salina.2
MVTASGKKKGKKAAAAVVEEDETMEDEEEVEEVEEEEPVKPQKKGKGNKKRTQQDAAIEDGGEEVERGKKQKPKDHVGDRRDKSPPPGKRVLIRPTCNLPSFEQADRVVPPFVLSLCSSALFLPASLPLFRSPSSPSFYSLLLLLLLPARSPAPSLPSFLFVVLPRLAPRRMRGAFYRTRASWTCLSAMKSRRH